MTATTTTWRANVSALKKETMDEWAYQGNTQFVGDFAVDIDAIANDSSSFSSESLEKDASITNNDSAYYNDSFGSEASTGGYANSAESLQGNHGSAYDGTMLDQYHKAVQRPELPNFGTSMADLNPLELWAQKPESHEWIAHRGVEPWTKRRKTAKGRTQSKTSAGQS